MELQQEMPNILNRDYNRLHCVNAYSHYPQEKGSVELDAEKRITVRKAVTIDDMTKVFRVRWEGYKKYYKSEDENMDTCDFSPHATLLLAEDKQHNAVGTLRILDRRYGSIELDKFVNIDSFLPDEQGMNVIEATRFSIPNHPDSKVIKLLLWKALLRYCEVNHIDTILMSARPAAARSYRSLFFENVGPLGVYKHTLLGNLEHQTYKATISKERRLLKEKNWPLYHFFFVKDHSNIKTDYFKFSETNDQTFELSVPKKRNGSFFS